MKLNESFEKTLDYTKKQIEEDEVKAEFSLQPEYCCYRQNRKY